MTSGLIFEWPCVEPGVRLVDCCGSVPTWGYSVILWKREEYTLGTAPLRKQF